MNESKSMSFAARCKDFFGFLPGQNVSDFMKELKALTQADKEEMVDLFNKAGLPTTLATAKADT